MKSKIKPFAILLVLLLLLSGCKQKESSSQSNEANRESSSDVNNDEMFTERDYRTDYDPDNSALIQLNGDSASCSSDAVSISGSTVTITDEGTYILSGTLNDGMIIVNADEKDKPQLVLNGVSITSKTSAPIYILEADKVVITLTDGTENTLINGGTFTAIDDNNIDSVIFSKQDLTLNGSGSLTVNSPAGHGIVSKDDLVFTSGTYSISSASHGLDANDSVRITNASLSIAAGKDGLHAENSDDTSLGFVYIASGSFQIEAEGDGMSAGSYMQIEDGSFDILTGGDSTSMKGIKSTGELVINNGNFTIDSADDAVHSNASITVNGGTFTIATGDDGFHADETLTIADGKISISESYEGLEALDISINGGEISLVSSDDGLNAAGGTDSSGFGGQHGNDQFGGRGGHGGMGGSSSSNGSINITNGNLYINASGDGIDANGSLTISGGYTVVCGPTQGDTATLDYDTSAVITGGTFIGTGASGMAQSFSDSQQGVIAVSAGIQSAQTTITLSDSNGNTIMTYEPELSFSVIILSSPDLIKGETYTLNVGTLSGEIEAY